MAITRSDCILLLTELKQSGVDTGETFKHLMSSADVDLDVIKFINDHRKLDISNFYEKLRKSYNNKRSNLYINIVKENLQDVQDVLTTLASLNLQILLFSRDVTDKQLFLKHARYSEICACLLNYSKTYDLVPCLKLLQLFKADLKALESTK